MSIKHINQAIKNLEDVMPYNHLKLKLTVLLISVFMNACGTLASTPTSTAVPTNTSIPPTNTPIPTSTSIPATNTPTVDSCEPGQNIFSPLNVTDYIGEIDGARLTREVEKLSGSEVTVTGKVIDSGYFYLPGQVDATIVLINIVGSNGKSYKAMIELPDKGLSVKQYLPDTDIHAVGVVLGKLPAPSPDFFKLIPNDNGMEYPLILAEIVSGGCK